MLLVCSRSDIWADSVNHSHLWANMLKYHLLLNVKEFIKCNSQLILSTHYLRNIIFPSQFLQPKMTRLSKAFKKYYNNLIYYLCYFVNWALPSCLDELNRHIENADDDEDGGLSEFAIQSPYNCNICGKRNANKGELRRQWDHINSSYLENVTLQNV